MSWLVAHKDFIEVTGILIADIATAASFWVNARVERAKMQFEVVREHRKVWEMGEEPRYKSAMTRKRDLGADPPSDDEAHFVNLVLNHLQGCFYASKGGIYAMPDCIREDIQDFLDRPVPRCIWENSKRYRDHAFVRFVERNKDDQRTN
jgi:hypothetical protein